MTPGDDNAADATRQRREREFHEARVAVCATGASEDSLRFEDSAWLDHESWVRDSFSFLGDVRGKRVLDYGCGTGMSSVVLARWGAEVFSFDIARGNAAVVVRRARANRVGDQVHVQTMAGERLAYRHQTFDAVYGNAVLHHVDMETAAGEVARVLKPCGVAVFSEPWGGNPILEFARRRVPYRCKSRTPDEQPLTERDTETLRRHFDHVDVYGYQLLSMIRRQLPWRPLIRVLEAADGALLRIPGLWRYCRYVVLVLRKDPPRGSPAPLGAPPSGGA